MMKQCPATLIFVTGLALGSWVPHWLSRPVSAAPRDVLGSNNVAVDVFRNTDGTWVLFADGSIANALDLDPDRRVNGPITDGESAYRVPDPSAKVGPAIAKPGRAQGSPRVAVKAISRGDITLVLFSDGTILEPQAVGPDRPSSVPGVLFMGSTRSPSLTELSNGLWEDNGDYRLEAFDVGPSGAKFRVTMNNALPGATKAVATYNVLATPGGVGHQVYTSIPVQGTSSDGGKTFVFDVGSQYPGYNNSHNQANMFTFSAVGD